MNEDFKRYFDIGVLHSMEKWILKTFGTAEKRGWAFLQSELSKLIEEKNSTCCLPLYYELLLNWLPIKLVAIIHSFLKNCFPLYP